MPVIDTKTLTVLEKRAGWRGRVIHSPSMTFVHWDFDAGASIHEHHHAQEEVWHVLEGELEMTIDGTKNLAGPGAVAILPAGTHHAVLARSAGKAIVVDYPTRPDFG